MTPTTDEETLILKTDTLGRVRMPRERREAILDEFESSGMSGQAFAKRIGVKYTTFASWRQQRRRRSGSNPTPKAKPEPTTVQLFEEVANPQPSVLGECLEVETRHGLKLSVRTKAEAGLAAELLRCLKEGGLC